MVQYKTNLVQFKMKLPTTLIWKNIHVEINVSSSINFTEGQEVIQHGQDQAHVEADGVRDEHLKAQAEAQTGCKQHNSHLDFQEIVHKGPYIWQVLSYQIQQLS